MKKFLLVVLVGFLFYGCSNDIQKVDSILKQEGCTDIVQTGADFIFSGCSDKDFYNNQFSCTKNGTRISGVVCSGIFKGYTVRYH